MRFSALWMLAIGLFSVGLSGEEIRTVSSRDPIPLGAPFQAKIEKSAIFPTPLCPGSSISYQITLTNQSNEGTPGLTASIGDPIPAGRPMSQEAPPTAPSSAASRIGWFGRDPLGASVSSEPYDCLLGNRQPGHYRWDTDHQHRQRKR